MKKVNEVFTSSCYPQKYVIHVKNTCICTFRGKYRSLWVGVLISLPSGAGVALSVLGGVTGSLVGVAISASLLSPTVNSVRADSLLFFTQGIIKHIKCFQDGILNLGDAIGIFYCLWHKATGITQQQ